ncbi:MAG: UbiA family prenyltransferase [Verrucomicrobiota bacterium]
MNNYRDVETDQKAGKRTLVVRIGRDFARKQFILAHALSALTPLLLVGVLGTDLILAVIMAAMVLVEGWRQTAELAAADTPAKCITLLGKTGRWLAIYAVLLSAAVLV